MRRHTADLQCDHTAWEWGYENERKEAEGDERKKEGGGSRKEALEGFARMKRGGWGWGGMISECVARCGCWKDVAAAADVQAGLWSSVLK